MVPGRAGQPTQALVHITLAQLRNLPGASEAEAAWRAAAAARGHGWLSGPDADAAACDATVAPVVTGHVDPAALDRLTEAFLALHGHGGGRRPARQPRPPGKRSRREARRPRRSGGWPRRSGGRSGREGGRPGPGVRVPVRRLHLPGPHAAIAGDDRAAARVAAGDGRRRAVRPRRPGHRGCASPSSPARQRRPGLPLDVPLPLDVGEAEPVIPAHLRRAATTRHPHCAFPGCDQPASVCQIHHLIPRSEGGPTALRNLVPLCAFHHLIVIHRWGWTLTPAHPTAPPPPPAPTAGAPTTATAPPGPQPTRPQSTRPSRRSTRPSCVKRGP